MLRLNSKYMSFVASVSVDVSLVAAQPSRSGYPRIVDAPKEAVAANLAHTGEPAGFCCTAWVRKWCCGRLLHRHV